MRSTSRRMLRLYLFCPLTQLNFPLKVTTLGGLCGDTAAASFYCSPARRHCSVITCLRPLFAQICPHFQLWKTPWKHISCITKQNSEDVVSTHSQMFLAEQPRSKICKLHSNLSINVFHLKVKQLSLHWSSCSKSICIIDFSPNALWFILPGKATRIWQLPFSPATHFMLW